MHEGNCQELKHNTLLAAKIEAETLDLIYDGVEIIAPGEKQIWPKATEGCSEKRNGWKGANMILTVEKANELMNLHGGWLDLSGTQITALPDNLTVGGWLDLSSTQIKIKNMRKLHNGDYEEGRYLYADGILTHIKRKKKVGNYIFFAGKIPNMNVVYDGKNYSHCKNFRKGIEDLRFKAAKDRGAEQYKGLSLSTERTVSELKTMYRVITGACQQGTERFVESFGNQLKERYTIREVIDLTKGQYGANCFSRFFGE